MSSGRYERILQRGLMRLASEKPQYRRAVQKLLGKKVAATKKEWVKIRRDYRDGYNILEAGDYLVEMPKYYDPKDITADDILNDPMLRTIPISEQYDQRTANDKSPLRKAIIRLAHENPDGIRQHLLPLVTHKEAGKSVDYWLTLISQAALTYKNSPRGGLSDLVLNLKDVASRLGGLLNLLATQFDDPQLKAAASQAHTLVRSLDRARGADQDLSHI